MTPETVGWGFTEVECDGVATFDLPIFESNGLFTGGAAEAQVWAYSLDDFDAYAFAQQTVRLSGMKTSKK